MRITSSKNRFNCIILYTETKENGLISIYNDVFIEFNNNLAYIVIHKKVYHLTNLFRVCYNLSYFDSYHHPYKYEAKGRK